MRRHGVVKGRMGEGRSGRLGFSGFWEISVVDSLNVCGITHLIQPSGIGTRINADKRRLKNLSHCDSVVVAYMDSAIGHFGDCLNCDLCD